MFRSTRSTAALRRARGRRGSALPLCLLLCPLALSWSCASPPEAPASLAPAPESSEPAPAPPPEPRAGVEALPETPPPAARQPAAPAPETPAGGEERAEWTMEVTVTAYNSLPGQTWGDPNIAAWGDRLEPGMRVIAVSRDLLDLGLTHNTEVRIEGMPGTWKVLDKLNRRWKRRIDVYMGTDRRAALQFGKQRLRIYWVPSSPPDR